MEAVFAMSKKKIYPINVSNVNYVQLDPIAQSQPECDLDAIQTCFQAVLRLMIFWV